MLLLSLIACASPQPRATSAPSTELAAAPIAASAAPSAASDWGGVVTGAGTLGTEPIAHATALRVGRHEGYDRVVIEFDAGVPGYELSFVEQILQAGSGRPLELTGDIDFLIALRPASGHSDQATVQTSADPSELANVVQVIRVDDYEGSLRFAVGMRARSEPTVRTLSGPPRLVLDFPSE